MNEPGVNIVTILSTMLVVFLTVQGWVADLPLAEQKILSWMQDRLGPMEVGWKGILQPIADGLKLFFKEDVIPAGANKVIFSIAPIISLVPALIGFAVIPFNKEPTLFGYVRPYITDINVGILYILAFGSVGAYGILLGGWASNSKYALLGGLRSAAQVISYELTMGLSIIGVAMMSQSLSLVEITRAQENHWYIFLQPVAFMLYFISGLAETNRVPFDLPEADSELVAGWFTEYSGMRFAFYFLAEYANMIIVSCVATILFLGGWNAPFQFLQVIPPVLWFLLKVGFILFLFIWLRGTLPRLRYDQLMRLGWKIMLPVALANVVVTAVALYWFKH